MVYQSVCNLLLLEMRAKRLYLRPSYLIGFGLDYNVRIISSPVFHFWPKLMHPAAQSLCDSSTSCSSIVTIWSVEHIELQLEMETAFHHLLLHFIRWLYATCCPKVCPWSPAFSRPFQVQVVTSQQREGTDMHGAVVGFPMIIRYFSRNFSHYF